MCPLQSTGAHTSLERTLLAWCQEVCANYSQYVSVSNFTTSWQDGWAFNAVLHYHKPEMFNFENLANLEDEERLEHAFEVSRHRDRRENPGIDFSRQGKILCNHRFQLF